VRNAVARELCSCLSLPAAATAKRITPRPITVFTRHTHVVPLLPPQLRSVAESQKGTLYGKGYNVHGCGTLSPQCEKYFVEEGCFYECDKNMGKWRKHADCTTPNSTKAGDNGWQIEAMPIKASYCDGWYEACKLDTVCAGPTFNIFEQPECLALNDKNNNTAGCKKFGDIYKSGKDVCEVMWGGSFKYETDESKGYVMAFTAGTVNPNNAIFTDKAYPPICAGHTVNITHPDGVDAIAAGCAADWHLQAGSGHPLSGTAPKAAPAPASLVEAPTSGAPTSAASAALAATLAAAAMTLLA